MLQSITEWIYVHMKAIVAGLGAAATMYYTLSPDGMTANDWVAVVVAFVVTGGFTFAVKNKVVGELLSAAESAYTSVTSTHPGMTVTVMPPTPAAEGGAPPVTMGDGTQTAVGGTSSTPMGFALTPGIQGLMPGTMRLDLGPVAAAIYASSIWDDIQAAKDKIYNQRY